MKLIVPAHNVSRREDQSLRLQYESVGSSAWDLCSFSRKQSVVIKPAITRVVHVSSSSSVSDYFSIFDTHEIGGSVDAKIFLKKNIEDLYYFDRQGGLAASAYSVILMEYMRSKKNFDQIDEIMSTIKVEDLSSRSIVSILRSTYSSRSVLSSWASFYNRSYAALISKGIDASRKLRGLNIA